MLIPGIEWTRKGQQSLYLTFDDGPNPESTNAILEILKENMVTATFFVVGQKVEDHPEFLTKLLSQGHSIGNHGFQHHSGWTTSHKSYLENVRKGAKISKSVLFRPPYGRMTPGQYHALKKEFKIILWDIMPGDFDLSRSSDDMLKIMKEKMEEGSIIVLHDLPKTIDVLKEILPDFIGYARQKGFNFKIL